jgi:hypothetical protein
VVVLGDFLDDLIGGCGVVAWSLVVGGVVWALAVLGAWRPLPTPAREALARCLRLVGAGAAGVVVAGSAQVTIKARLLAAALGRSAFPEFASTPFFLAHLVQAMVAVAVLAADVLVRRRPGARGGRRSPSRRRRSSPTRPGSCTGRAASSTGARS